MMQKSLSELRWSQSGRFTYLTIEANEKNSLGRPGIFLLETSAYIPGELPHGNTESSSKTIIPIVLRHGDIMVTGGHSRLAYHAVPRLLTWQHPTTDLSPDFFPHLLSAASAQFDKVAVRENLENYVFTTRLNMNVRQVN